tara:strand:+ start:331 stop:714 length:384 start_codon:yes stop_codon:yes gene_type:complete
MRIQVGLYKINTSLDLSLPSTKKFGSPSRQRNSLRYHKGKLIAGTIPDFRPSIVDYFRIGKAQSYHGDPRSNPKASDTNFDGVNRNGRPMQKASARLARYNRDRLNSSRPFLKSSVCKDGKEKPINC